MLWENHFGSPSKWCWLSEIERNAHIAHLHDITSKLNRADFDSCCFPFTQMLHCDKPNQLAMASNGGKGTHIQTLFRSDHKEPNFAGTTLIIVEYARGHLYILYKCWQKESKQLPWWEQPAHHSSIPWSLVIPNNSENAYLNEGSNVRIIPKPWALRILCDKPTEGYQNVREQAQNVCSFVNDQI